MQLPLFIDNTILPTDKFHISYSEFLDWFQCSHRHKLKHIDKIDLDGSSVHTIFGSLLHDALEQYVLTGKVPSTNETVQKLKAGIGELMFTENAISPEEAKEFIDAVEPILIQAPKWLDEEFPGWKLVSAEEQLFEPIEGQKNKYFKGFIDLVIKVPKKKKGSGTRLSSLKGEIIPGEWVYWIIDWKGQRLSAPILTPKGWTTMGELEIGQEIISSTGGTCKVTGIFPLGEREVYRVHFRDGSFTDVTDDHLWKVYRSDGLSKVLTTKELINERKYVYIPTLSAPALFDKEYRYPVQPYILGLLLGDGEISNSVKFTTNDQCLLDTILSNPKWEVGYYNPKLKTPTYVIKNAIKEMTLLNLKGCRSWEKHIPKDYLFGSPQQRLELLQGLLDTDGWVQKGVAKFSTASEQLAKDVKHLVGSLGGTAFISQRPKRSISNHIKYIVTIRLPVGLKPFRLQRKLNKWNANNYQKNNRRRISKVELLPEKDQMQCIAVDAPDHLYVTEDFIVTHNTTNWGWRAEQKRSFEKHMQLIFYKHFWCIKHKIDIKDVRCGFAFLCRKSKKDGSRIDFLPISVGPRAIEKAMSELHDCLNQIQAKMFLKNKMSCRFCKYAGTKHCP